MEFNDFQLQEDEDDIIPQTNDPEIDPYRVRIFDKNHTLLFCSQNLEILADHNEFIPEEIILLMENEVSFEEIEISKLLHFNHDNTPSIIPSLNTRKRKGDAIHSRQIAYNKKKLF